MEGYVLALGDLTGTEIIWKCPGPYRPGLYCYWSNKMSPARGLYLARAVKILSPLTAGCESTLHEKEPASGYKGFSLHYTKEVIQIYQEHRWKSLATSRLNVLGSSNTNDKMESLLLNMDSHSKNLDKNNFLFNHGTTKKEDSHIMDFTHGNSPLFEDKCDVCQQFWDSPLHQLFWCKELEDQSHTNLMEVITNSESYVTEVLFPKKKNVQQRFIERIRFLMDQHELVYELQSYDSE